MQTVTQPIQVGTCIICKLALGDTSTHRTCLLTGLEQGLFQSKADWLKQSTPKPKPKKMIRKVLVD